MDTGCFHILAVIYIYLKILFIYLTEREGEPESTRRGGGWQREKEKQAAGSPLSRKPDVGLDLRTLGS